MREADVAEPHLDKMVLMDAPVDLAIPDRGAPNLVYAPVTFDDQQVTGLQSHSIDFASGQANVLHSLQVDMTGANVSNAQIRQLQV